ncbi:hypothetical protein JHK86_016665 [Glycine max]|nr:hypothetical protein JHK86_016665 [Glycine max]
MEQEIVGFGLNWVEAEPGWTHLNGLSNDRWRLKGWRKKGFVAFREEEGLQSSDSPGIHALVSDYPCPLSDLKPTKKSNPDQTLIRSLSKRFLSFLKASLSILPKWFPEVSKSNNAISLLELLCIYKLCLNCLDLASKPFSVKFQRLRLIHCLESCGLFDEAQLEGVGVLEKLPPTKRKGKLLLEIDKGNGEGKELCSLVVDIVVSLLRCVAAGLAKEDAHFRKVLQLVEEVNP